MPTYCYFDVTIGGEPMEERIVMELFDDITPKTCENFRELCTGNGGQMVEGTTIPMSYKNCSFHRIIPNFMIQGGDFTNHNGTGGVSIFGEKFEDENFELLCDKPGLLAMANAGPNTNGSQFFITTVPTPHLNGKHVVFGKVVRGMNTVRLLENTPTGAQDTPISPCLIADCGVLDALPEVVAPADGDFFTEYPEDNEPAMNEEKIGESAETIRQLGNAAFKEGNYDVAIKKYRKASHYFTKAGLREEGLVACYNNMALSLFKLSRWKEAKLSACDALGVDENNAKAWYRCGLSDLQLNNSESAIENLKKAHAIDPENADIKSALQQAKEKEKARTAKLAARLKTFFDA